MKNVRRFLCVMLVAVSLFTISAFAANPYFNFETRDRTEYTVAGSAMKNERGSADVYPTSGRNYAGGICFRISNGRDVEDACTSVVTVYNTDDFIITYPSGKDTLVTKYLLARCATALAVNQGDANMRGSWIP